MAGAIHDISPPITPELAVFPGDTPASREVLMDIERGDHLTLSTLRATVHLGAHADGTNHYGKGAPSIDQHPLDLYLGPCRVIDVTGARGERVGIDDLTGAPDRPRVLLRTDSQPDKAVFNEDFRGLDPALIEHLGERGVGTVGIDTPSVDTAGSKDLPGHAACLRAGVSIIEGLVLDGVPPGEYELIALPLKLVGFDGSPIRAVLREL